MIGVCARTTPCLSFGINNHRMRGYGKDLVNSPSANTAKAPGNYNHRLIMSITLLQRIQSFLKYVRIDAG